MRDKFKMVVATMDERIGMLEDLFSSMDILIGHDFDEEEIKELPDEDRKKLFHLVDLVYHILGNLTDEINTHRRKIIRLQHHQSEIDNYICDLSIPI